jgi:7-keto-8-aminopelargonate synthetase-like enzyme
MPRPASFSLSVRDLLPRVASVAARHGADRLFLFSSATEATAPAIFDPREHRSPALNFATQDYLALATHPALRTAAMASLGQHRLCPPGQLRIWA